MATLVSDIIQQAYRDGNLIPIGATVTSAESTEGLKRLQVLILSVLGHEGGEKLSAFPVGNNNVTNPTDWVPTVNSTDYLPLNVRVVANLEAAQTLYLNPKPQDGSRLAVIDASANFATYNLTLNGNGRKVDGGTTDVLSTNSQSIQYFYRADLGDWKVITTLATSDEMPFPEEFDDFFVILLAMRLNPRNSQPMSQESAAMLERAREQFRSRYSQIINTPADLGVLNLSQRINQRGSIYNGWQ